MPPDFSPGQLRRGITLIAENAHMVPTRGFTDDKHDISVINVLRCLVRKLLRRVKERIVIGRFIDPRPGVQPQRRKPV